MNDSYDYGIEQLNKTTMKNIKQTLKFIGYLAILLAAALAATACIGVIGAVIVESYNNTLSWF